MAKRWSGSVVVFFGVFSYSQVFLSIFSSCFVVFLVVSNVFVSCFVIF